LFQKNVEKKPIVSFKNAHALSDELVSKEIARTAENLGVKYSPEEIATIKNRIWDRHAASLQTVRKGLNAGPPRAVSRRF
jgi:hypothetical protein